MNHAEIRYRLLFVLYLKHYSDQLLNPQVTDKVIEEAGLEYVDKNMVYGDIVYLDQKNLTRGKYVLGKSYPYTIIITPMGIDVVDKMVYSFIEFLRTDEDEDSKRQFNTLITMGETTARFSELKGIIQKDANRFRRFIEKIGWPLSS